MNRFAHKFNTIDLRDAHTQRLASLHPHTLDLRAGKKETKYLFSQQVSGKKKLSIFFSARKDVMSGVYRVASIAIAVGVSWVYLPLLTSSLAYFTDTEAGPAYLTAGLLDLVVTDPAFISLGCAPEERMGDASIELSRAAAGAPLRIKATVASTSGTVALCDAVWIDVQNRTGAGNTLVYQGTSTNFSADNVREGDLRFIASLSAGAGTFASGTSCTLNIGFDAWDGEAVAGGFSDYEVAPVTFAVDNETCGENGCEPPCTGGCGDLIVVTENHNDATVTNTIVVSANTGNNSVSGGGTVTTGDASSSARIINVVNTNTTTVVNECSCGIGCSCPPPCTGACESTTTIITNNTNTSESTTIIVSATSTQGTSSTVPDVNSLLSDLKAKLAFPRR